MSPAESRYRQFLNFGALVRGGRVVPNWLEDGSSFWYLKRGANEPQPVKVNPVTNTEEPLQEQVFPSAQPSTYAYADLVPSEAERESPREFVRWKFYATGRREPAAEAKSPDGRWILTVTDYNLALRSTIDGQAVKLTEDGTEITFWDFDPALWQPWSPVGSHFVAVKQYTQGMARIPTLEWLKPREQVREIIALPAGGKLYRTELYIFDLYSQQPTRIDLGETTNQYVRILEWLPDGSELMIARYNRVLSAVELQAVNLCTGSVRTLLTESCATFLTHHHEVFWGKATGFTLLPDGSGFIWNSERSGWDHLYHYDLAGRCVRPLTTGSWRVEQVVRVDLAEGWVYFTGHGDPQRPYDTHLYRVRLNGRELAQLTEGTGQHNVVLSPSGRYFVDSFSALDVPPSSVLRASDGTWVRSLEEADVSALEALGWVPSREYQVKAADGTTDLWATIHFPCNWDPGRKYPVVEYIYGGPQSLVRPMDFGDQPQTEIHAFQENFNRALAQLGFLVVILDARGTPGRSKAFQDVVYRNFGRFEVDDHVAALRQLGERLPSLDLDRVGVWGWSWGGQFAFRALTQAPDLYKAGVCGWPALDLQRLMLYEAYLGMPQENGDGYRAADPYALAPKLKGTLLLIGGMNDPSTQADLFKLSEILIRLGKQHLTMSYPNCGHGAAGKNAEYDVELKRRFFMEHLMNRSGSNSGASVPSADHPAGSCTH